MAEPTLSRRVLLVAGSATALHATTAALGAALSGCDGATTGMRVTYESTAQSDVAAGEAFDTALGWTITLDEAWIYLEYLRYAQGSPVAAAPRGRSLPRRLAAWLVPEAQAHPGHYDEGATLGEMRTPQLVELLGAPQTLGAEPGVSGDAHSALVRFHGDDSASASYPDAVAFVAGTATRDGVSRPFVAVATRDEVLDTSSDLPEVPGCPLDGGPMDADGTIHLEVQLRLWVDQIDFALVPEPAQDEDAIELTVGEPPHNAFLRGVKKAAAYQFHYEPA